MSLLPRGRDKKKMLQCRPGKDRRTMCFSSSPKTNRFGGGDNSEPCKIFEEEGGSCSRPVEGCRSKNCSTSNALDRPKRIRFCYKCISKVLLQKAFSVILWSNFSRISAPRLNGVIADRVNDHAPYTAKYVLFRRPHTCDVSQTRIMLTNRTSRKRHESAFLWVSRAHGSTTIMLFTERAGVFPVFFWTRQFYFFYSNTKMNHLRPPKQIL